MNVLSLKRKTEKNFLHFLGEKLAPQVITPGQNYGLDAKIKLPGLILEASEARPDEELGDDAVALVTLTCTVVTDTRVDADSSAADSLSSKVWGELLDEDLPKEFNDPDTELPEPEYHLYEVNWAGEDTQYNGDQRMDILTVHILCHEILDS
jgi:hypothetical protein